MHRVILDFHDKKHANKLLRHLQQGKGMVVKPVMVGAGFLDTLKSVASNPIVQNIGNKVLDKGLDMAGKYIENKMSGNGIGDVRSTLVLGRGRPRKGDGLLGGIGGVLGNALDDKLGFGVKKRGRPRKGKGLLGGIGGVLGNALDDKLGFGVKGGKKSVQQPRALALYQQRKRGGSFAPLA